MTLVWNIVIQLFMLLQIMIIFVTLLKFNLMNDLVCIYIYKYNNIFINLYKNPEY